MLFINNCSLNKDSQYWTEDSIKKKDEQKKFSKILKKKENLKLIRKFFIAIHLMYLKNIKLTFYLRQ